MTNKRAKTVKQRETTIEAIRILHGLIPYLKNKEIIDYCGLPDNYIYEKLGKTGGRRKANPDVDIENYSDELNRLIEIYDETSHKNPAPREALVDNDKLHLYETAQNPFNKLHTMVWR